MVVVGRKQGEGGREAALETLVLQMTNSEHVYIINSVLRCVRMYCLTDG